MGRKQRNNDWKRRDGIVYSTNDDFEYSEDSLNEEETLPPGKQRLRILLDTKSRAGKKVTLVRGFVGADDDLKELARQLKNYCGIGGSSKDGEILLQGDLRLKASEYLEKKGYNIS